MYKKTVTYTNLDGDRKEKVLYFNYTATQLMDVLERHGISFDKLDKFQDYIKSLEAEGKTMEMVSFIHDIIINAYGERDESGDHFYKSAEISKDFDNSLMFEEFFLDLMKHPDELSKLMRGATASIQQLNPEADKQVGLRPLA